MVTVVHDAPRTFADRPDRAIRERRYRGAVHIGPAPQGAPRVFIIVWGSEGRVQRMNRAYELMIIIDGDVDDPKAQAWMKTVTEAVKTAGGELARQDRLVGQAPVRLPDQQEAVRLLHGR